MKTKNQPGAELTDSTVTAIFEGVSPRPCASAQDRAAVFDAVYAQWDQLTARRVRRRRAGIGLLAASVVLSLAVLLLRPAGPYPAVLVASLDRVQGTVMIDRGGSSVWHTIREKTPRIHAGDRIKVVDGAVGLRLVSGGSLRIAQNSTVLLLEQATVDMSSGLLYFDSGYGGQDASIVVKTPYGNVRDIGTQFAVRADDTALSVSVRTGSVEVNRHREAALVADAGERLTLDKDGGHGQVSVSGTGDEWLWAQQLSPGFDREGRTPMQLLEWFTHETGYGVSFDSAKAAQTASEKRLFGGIMNEITLEALSLTLATVRLVVGPDLESGKIVISIQD